MAILGDAAAAGVTSVREAATGAVLGVGEVGLLHQLNAARPLPTRVSTAQWALCGAAAWADAGVTPFAGDEMVRADAWKIVTDGSNQGRSGYFEQPYLGEASGGHPNFTPEQLHQLMADGLDGGWQLMVHANGDAAVEFALEAYEQALAGRPATDLRHRMEHVSFSYRRQLERMAAIGVSPSFLMNHVYYWGRVFRDVILGPERADRLDRVASALQAGLRPSLHSDYNVTQMEPLLAAKTAATRVMRDGGEVLNPAECVSAEEALRAITVDAAWQIHADDRGTLAVGNLADWTVLSDNPWESIPDAWPDITVLETRVGGRVTHQA
jgi:predicted amidohydrolase YtcJ